MSCPARHHSHHHHRHCITCPLHVPFLAKPPVSSVIDFCVNLLLNASSSQAVEAHGAAVAAVEEADGMRRRPARASLVVICHHVPGPRNPHGNNVTMSQVKDPPLACNMLALADKKNAGSPAMPSEIGVAKKGPSPLIMMMSSHLGQKSPQFVRHPQLSSLYRRALLEVISIANL